MCTHNTAQATRRRHHTDSHSQYSSHCALPASAPPRPTPHAPRHSGQRGRRHENSSVAASSRVSSERAGGESGGWRGLPPRLYAAPRRNAGLPRGQIGLSRRRCSRIGVFLAWFRPELGSCGGRREKGVRERAVSWFSARQRFGTFFSVLEAAVFFSALVSFGA